MLKGAPCLRCLRLHPKGHWGLNAVVHGEDGVLLGRIHAFDCGVYGDQPLRYAVRNAAGQLAEYPPCALQLWTPQGLRVHTALVRYNHLTLIPVTLGIAQEQPWKKGFPRLTTLEQDAQDPKIRGSSTGRSIVAVMDVGDKLYYWDGPWGVLSGSSGLAVVRAGSVVDTFTFVRS